MKCGMEQMLHRLCHQILTADEAEDGDGVVLIEDAEGAEDFIEGGAAGGDVVYDENVLLANGGTELLVCRRRESQEMGHVWTKTTLLHVLGDGEIVLTMDEVEHLADGLPHLFLLGLRITGTPILKDVIEVLLLVSLHIKRDTGGQGFDQLKFL